MILAETFHAGSLVSPPLATNGLANVMTLESKVKSPWNPIKLAPWVVVLLMSDVVTGMRTTPDGEGAIVATGRATVIDNAGHSGGSNIGVGIGCGVGDGVGVGGTGLAVGVGTLQSYCTVSMPM